MPKSTDQKSSGIPVRVFYETGDEKRGVLYYRKEGPIIKFYDDVFLDHTNDVKFSFFENSEIIQSTKLKPTDKALLEPESVTKLKFLPTGSSRIQMYPPSSGNWLSHVGETGIDSIFTVQRLTGSPKKLLTIVDETSLEFRHAVLIQSYESSILKMERDWNIYNDLLYSDIPETSISDILSEEPPSWATLSKLVQNVTIPNLTIRNTMGETLDQLVPKGFPQNIRMQIMAFLGWLDSASIPKEDPVDFGMKYQSVGVFRALVWGHLQCMLDNVEPPEYVRIMLLADRGQLNIAQRARAEAAEQDPWNLVRLKLNEIHPDWTVRVIDYALSLQEKNQIITELPISRKDAEKSLKAWGDRFAMVNQGLFMRGHIHKESLGLIPAVYIGSAHRWPHDHLEWSARLGYNTEKPQYVQVMVMPPSTFLRASRIIPTLQIVDWDMSRVNLHLYDGGRRKWKIQSSILAKSMGRKRSINQLKNEFGHWRGKKPLLLSRKQLRILDLLSWGFYLSFLESGIYTDYFGITNQEISDTLNTLHAKGAFVLQYLLITQKLRSICIIAKGHSENICSMARSFLKHTPSSQVRITRGGDSCVIVSRVPEDEYYDIITSLTNAANETDLSLEIAPISAYAGYRNNLYSRLLKEDGSWNDDISGLLDQIRLPRKDAL